ncbi:glycosyltransferase family 9 protein [Burkholderia sp. MSMB1459WGS]|uniref:glycosyltransferase family 9 protein n=1 Tax=Burkholderia sp. MSMB1459WGS TaxID=1637970 RepID=UPI0009E9F1BA
MTPLFVEPLAPRAILVICTERIGDVLLSTPAVRSLKLHWPGAQIDMLVFDGTAVALQNNPDIRHVISVPRRTTISERFATIRQIWRRYDLACTLRSSSVATFYCWMAGRTRIGVVPPSGKGWFRRRLLNHFAVEHDRSAHVVESSALLMSLLGIPACFDVVPPGVGNESGKLKRLDQLLTCGGSSSFVVVHTYPKFTYKMWHVEGWVSVIRFARSHGYAIVLTGGPAPAEVLYTKNVASRAGGDVINLAGKLSFGETAEVIRRASLFVGPDTSVSHVAAATGIPTIVLFGPSNPVRWGPWPKGWSGRSPWKLVGSGQKGNVYLVQGTAACVPCQREGCGKSIHSSSDCLQNLDAHRVIKAAAKLLRVAPRETVGIPVVAQAPGDMSNPVTVENIG